MRAKAALRILYIGGIMFTAKKLVTYCAGLAYAAGCWPEWIAARDRIFLTAPSPSFREACLSALREVGIPQAAEELLSLEADNERARAGNLAHVDDLP